jgi:hypothetical protein
MASKIDVLDRQELSSLVEANHSFSGILKDLGLVPRGGNIKTLKKKLDQYGISYSHIPQGKDSNAGMNRSEGYSFQHSNDFMIVVDGIEELACNIYLPSVKKEPNDFIVFTMNHIIYPVNNLIYYYEWMKSGSKKAIQIITLNKDLGASTCFYYKDCCPMNIDPPALSKDSKDKSFFSVSIDYNEFIMTDGLKDKVREDILADEE